MSRTRRQILTAIAALPVMGGPLFAFGTSTPSPSPLPGIDIALTRTPAGDPIAPIHIDAEHGKALVKMGPMQAGQFMANILAPKLEKLTGVSGRSWHWVLSNHLTEEVTGAILNGGGTELSGLQFAEDQGATTWGLSIRATPAG